MKYIIAAVQNDLTVVRSEFPSLLQAMRGARRAGLAHNASGLVRVYAPNDQLLLTRDFVPF